MENGQAIRTSPQELKAAILERDPQLKECPDIWFEPKHITWGLNHCGLAVIPESANYDDFYLCNIMMSEQDARRIADAGKRAAIARQKVVSA